MTLKLAQRMPTGLSMLKCKVSVTLHLHNRYVTPDVGSGDSTLPSPFPVKQKHDPSERVIVVYAGSNPSTVYNPLDPPSPNTLARRLEDLSPRLPSPPLLDDYSESASGSNSFPPSTVTLSTQLITVESGSSPPRPPLANSSVPPRVKDGSVESRAALKDTIRGVYYLWKSGRRLCARTEGEDEEEFMSIVRQAMAEPSLP
jgi:hypothetical protein